MLLGTQIKPQYFYKLMSNRVKKYFLVNQFFSEASGSCSIDPLNGKTCKGFKKFHAEEWKLL